MDLLNLIDGHRKAVGMTKKALHTSAGISPSYFYEIMKGTKQPSLGTLTSLCDVLGLKLTISLKD